MSAKEVRQTHDQKVSLIVNPTSGKGLKGKGWKEYKKTVDRILGTDYNLLLTEQAGDATRLTRKLLADGYDLIIATGGDGTINEVANGFFQAGSFDPMKAKRFEDPSMGVIPLGTRNVFAKSVGLPEHVEEACERLTEPTFKRIDVIKCEATRLSGPRVFLNAAEIGLGAEVIAETRRIRKKVHNRTISTVAGIIKTLARYDGSRTRIRLANGQKIDTSMTMGVVANGQYIGGGLQAAPFADMDDGLLDLVVLRDSDGLSAIPKIAAMRNGKHLEAESVIYQQSGKVSLTAQRMAVVPVTGDGESFGRLPAQFTVMPNVLRLAI